MKKVLKWTIGIVAFIYLLFNFVIWPYVLVPKTKQISPEQTISKTIAASDITVFYNRPYKKNRVIFGELVPYGKVWRTGANECTTFESSKDLVIGGEPLPAGKYTLWTIPDKDSWQVIFNNKMYDWGVTLISGGKKTPRDADADVATITVPTKKTDSIIEQFTISLDENSLSFLWDTTKVSVPIQ